MRVYIFQFQDPSSDIGVGTVIVKELREDLARNIALEHIEEKGHDPEDIDLNLVEEFDYRDREIHTDVEQI